MKTINISNRQFATGGLSILITFTAIISSFAATAKPTEIIRNYFTPGAAPVSHEEFGNALLQLKNPTTFGSTAEAVDVEIGIIAKSLFERANIKNAPLITNPAHLAEQLRAFQFLLFSQCPLPEERVNAMAEYNVELDGLLEFWEKQLQPDQISRIEDSLREMATTFHKLAQQPESDTFGITSSLNRTRVTRGQHAKPSLQHPVGGIIVIHVDAGRSPAEVARAIQLAWKFDSSATRFIIKVPRSVSGMGTAFLDLSSINRNSLHVLALIKKALTERKAHPRLRFIQPGMTWEDFQALLQPNELFIVEPDLRTETIASPDVLILGKFSIYAEVHESGNIEIPRSRFPIDQDTPAGKIDHATIASAMQTLGESLFAKGINGRIEVEFIVVPDGKEGLMLIPYKVYLR